MVCEAYLLQEFVERSRFLSARGLGKHFGALERLGAKRVSDLALLTSDDFDQLGVGAAERELFRIELR